MSENLGEKLYRERMSDLDKVRNRWPMKRKIVRARKRYEHIKQGGIPWPIPERAR